MNNNELIITLIFAAIAAFVLFKLRSVLGRRTGHEQQRDVFGRDSGTGSAPDNVVSLPERGSHQTVDIEPNSPVAVGVADIQAVDAAFDPGEFLDGAKAAFKMIVTAFAEGARETLEPLLGADVYASFDAAIAEREKNNETMALTFAGFKSADITQARLDDHEARVTVKFVTEQSSTVTDAAGNVVDGDPNEVAVVTDVWTFARDTRSRDPNWQLVETDTSE
jgi:predicted lipid-binding transport protein (Tim44 family)